MATPTHLAPPTFSIRPATPSDAPAMTDVFFHSFNAPFWRYLFPPTAPQFITDTWLVGLANPTDATFVVEDTSTPEKRIVAFSRWMVPQGDGNLERKFPEMEGYGFDMEVAGAFFGGMEANREKLMGGRSHWMLELLGVHEDYQERGIAGSLIKWGTDQADRDGLETYLDGSLKGQPYYVKRHGFVAAAEIDIPDRPEYGHYAYMSMVRAPQKKS